MNKLLFASTTLAALALLPMQANAQDAETAECGEVSIAQMNWAAAEVTTERLTNVLEPGGVEGWWIPTKLAEEHPELTTIEGVMKNPDLVGGQFNNCPDGWGCRVVSDNLVRALDL